ncbi:MAG: hypothetical protein MUF50_02430 [Planctomycetes bacterium]|jgi:nitrogen fixation-related uncharacterized protein|nr:hypothetical protein [Planctomycetota bacterium]
MNKQRLILPISILLGCVILGGFIYASQTNKQQSIEKQQRLDLDIKQKELQIKKESDQLKVEWDKKEYIAKRKKECYDLYLQEKKNWNNVKDFSYSEVRDVCLVKYLLDEPIKTKDECWKIIASISESTGEILTDMILDNYNNCLSNWFSKEF